MGRGAFRPGGPRFCTAAEPFGLWGRTERGRGPPFWAFPLGRAARGLAPLCPRPSGDGPAGPARVLDAALRLRPGGDCPPRRRARKTGDRGATSTRTPLVGDHPQTPTANKHAPRVHAAIPWDLAAARPGRRGGHPRRRNVLLPAANLAPPWPLRFLQAARAAGSGPSWPPTRPAPSSREPSSPPLTTLRDSRPDRPGRHPGKKR